MKQGNTRECHLNDLLLVFVSVFVFDESSNKGGGSLDLCCQARGRAIRTGDVFLVTKTRLHQPGEREEGKEKRKKGDDNADSQEGSQ